MKDLTELRNRNFKADTIGACREEIEDLKSPSIWRIENNPLCWIYKPGACADCRGCFIADKFGTRGCAGLRKTANDFKRNLIKWSWDNESTMTGCEYLIAFYRRSIPVLEKIDAQYFTPQGWKHEAFEEIFEIADSLYDEAGGPEAKIVQPGLNCRPYGNI